MWMFESKTSSSTPFMDYYLSAVKPTLRAHSHQLTLARTRICKWLSAQNKIRGTSATCFSADTCLTLVVKLSYIFHNFCPFLAHGWRSHAMSFRCGSCGTRSLFHSLTRFWLIYSLNSRPVPPLLSIAFVSIVFLAQRLQVSGGSTKA